MCFYLFKGKFKKELSPDLKKKKIHVVFFPSYLWSHEFREWVPAAQAIFHWFSQALPFSGWSQLAGNSVEPFSLAYFIVNFFHVFQLSTIRMLDMLHYLSWQESYLLLINQLHILVTDIIYRLRISLWY